MGLEQRINSSGEYCKVPVKDGHTWPWVRDCVVDSEIAASWVHSPRTRVYTVVEKVPSVTR
jgi:hypothetical protein